jgi:hypothetical protein
MATCILRIRFTLRSHHLEEHRHASCKTHYKNKGSYKSAIKFASIRTTLKNVAHLVRGFRTPRKNAAHLIVGTPKRGARQSPPATPFDPLALVLLVAEVPQLTNQQSPTPGHLHILQQSPKRLQRMGFRVLTDCPPPLSRNQPLQ